MWEVFVKKKKVFFLAHFACEDWTIPCVLILCSFWQVLETTERIDIEKLKQRERICFYDDIMLFEDELSDNGCSVLSVKIVSVFHPFGVCVVVVVVVGGVCHNVYVSF